MNTNVMSSGRPLWNYGKQAGFGLWVTALKDAKLFVAIYKGVVFSRKTTVLWKANVTAKAGVSEPTGDSSPTAPTAPTGTTGATAQDHELTMEFKQAVAPELIVVPPCGAEVPYSDFPIVLFASESSVVYSGDDIKTFKKLASLSEEEFYEKTTGGGASSFTLPELDEDVYNTNREPEKTKVGLLVPLWRISAEKDSLGDVRVTEVLDIRTQDGFVFERDDSAEPEDETPDDTCVEEDGVEGGGLGGGGLPPDPDDGAAGGASDEAGSGGAKPCPDDSAG